MTDQLPTADDTLTLLTERFADLPPQLQRAARYVIDRPREVGVHSMRALAGRAEVHPNTLVRLAQAIGFDGWDTLRERFRHFVVAGGSGGFRERADWLRTLAAEGGTAEIIAEMAAATAENLETTWQRQDAAALEAAADAIIAAPRCFVLGVGSAQSLAQHFWYVARMAFEHLYPIPRPGLTPVDELVRIGPGDVLVALTFQPYRAETLSGVRQAREAGATVIGVTDSPTSPLARVSDHLLVSPTHTPQFFESHAAVLALLEGLVAVMVARAGEDASARIEAFHRARLAAGLYEEPAPLAQLG